MPEVSKVSALISNYSNGILNSLSKISPNKSGSTGGYLSALPKYTITPSPFKTLRVHKNHSFLIWIINIKYLIYYTESSSLEFVWIISVGNCMFI